MTKPRTLPDYEDLLGVIRTHALADKRGAFIVPPKDGDYVDRDDAQVKLLERELRRLNSDRQRTSR